jgi:hypothetical protein
MLQGSERIYTTCALGCTGQVFEIFIRGSLSYVSLPVQGSVGRKCRVQFVLSYVWHA